MEKPNNDELIAYLDGELDPPASQQIEERLKHDPAYRQALSQHERSWDMLDRLERASVGENFSRTTLEMVSLVAAEEQRELSTVRRFDWRRTGIMALVAAAAAVLGYAGGRAMWPDPNRDLLADLPILEDFDFYEQAGSIDFLRKLEHSGQFRDDAGLVKATPGLAVPEALADRRAEIARMTPAEKEHLARKLDRFADYSSRQQQRLRELYESLNEGTDGRQLREVLVRYHEWLDTLLFSVREELNDLSDDERIARIGQIRHEQAAGRKQELAQTTEQDLTALITWLEDFTWQKRQALLATVSDKRQKYFAGLDEEPQRRALLWMWMAQSRGPGHSPSAQIHLTDSDIGRLAERLSPGARAELGAAHDRADKGRVIMRWGRHQIESGGLRQFLPPVSWSELRRFMNEELSSPQRGALATMPREKKFRELLRLYFFSDDRLAQLKPEEITSKPPGRGGPPARHPGEGRPADGRPADGHPPDGKP